MCLKICYKHKCLYVRFPYVRSEGASMHIRLRGYAQRFQLVLLCTRPKKRCRIWQGGGGAWHRSQLQAPSACPMCTSPYKGDACWVGVATHNPLSLCAPFFIHVAHTYRWGIRDPARGVTLITLTPPPSCNYYQQVWYVHPYLTKNPSAIPGAPHPSPPPPPPAHVHQSCVCPDVCLRFCTLLTFYSTIMK